MGMRIIVLSQSFCIYISVNTAHADAQYYEPPLGFQLCQRQIWDRELGYGFLCRGKVTLLFYN